MFVLVVCARYIKNNTLYVFDFYLFVKTTRNVQESPKTVKEKLSLDEWFSLIVLL